APRRPAGQHPGRPRSPGLRAMVTVRGRRRGSVTARRSGALIAAAVALRGRLRGSRNMHDASSPRQATSWQCPAHIPQSALQKKEETLNMPDIAPGRGREARGAAMAAEVSVPGEAGFDQAGRGWTRAVAQRPAVVVEAGSAADVAQAVRFARAHG